MQYVSVRILSLPYNADKSYEYAVPDFLQGKIKAGSLSLVPFGVSNNVQLAIVEEVSEKKTYNKKLKPVFDMAGGYLRINEELLSLCAYMRDMLLCSTGDALRCMLPSSIGICRTHYYTKKAKAVLNSENSLHNSIFDYIGLNERVSFEELRHKFGASAKQAISTLKQTRCIIEQEGYYCRVNEKHEKYVALAHTDMVIDNINSMALNFTPRQQIVYDIISDIEGDISVSELMQLSGLRTSKVLEDMAKLGILRMYDLELDRSQEIINQEISGMYGDFELSEEQNAAYSRLFELYNDSEAQACLLHGVTGSGKTNVILKLIDKVIESGKTVIVLVPEIALTSQTVGRFTARYSKDGIVLIHSGLSLGERADARRRIMQGKAKIVIGTRSAVFAPVENLGLIVMDEEHEGSFKSDKSPKYHARDIARFRCAYNKALLVMASATPLIESYYRAKSGRYNLVTLKNRYGAATLPEVSFYDMKDEPFFVMPDDKFDAEADNLPIMQEEESEAVPLILGRELTKELHECIDKNKQAILFINRRGYRAFAVCRSCGYVFTCPNCSVSMTHHKDKRTGKQSMMCHYCGKTQEVPDICPSCSKKRISFVGSGTQLLEETLNKQFPETYVLRMDADTTTGKLSHERILSDFRHKKASVLVGTQMVAKGHDFPDVSLVGVALADTSLFLNDFRANEKTFSLITQVLGRAGRHNNKGKAIIQTYVPDNDVLQLAAKQDYESFYDIEIAFRKANVFPPFCDIVNIGLSSLVESDLKTAVNTFGKMLYELANSKYPDNKFILYGPFKNEIYRIAGRYRMRYMIKCRNTSRIRQMLSELLKAGMTSFKNTSISIDINPTNL